MKIIIDSREPSPHPWEAYLPEDWKVEINALETGDLTLAELPDGVVIERKTASDLAGCMGGNRERFERELKRSRYCGRFIIVCEGSFAEVILAGRGLNRNAIVGTVAAWSVRYCPIVFAGSIANAANFAFRSLHTQIRDIERAAKRILPAEAKRILSREEVETSSSKCKRILTREALENATNQPY